MAATLREMNAREAAERACGERNKLRRQHAHVSAADLRACAGCQDAEQTAAVAYRVYLATGRCGR